MVPPIFASCCNEVREWIPRHLDERAAQFLNAAHAATVKDEGRLFSYLTALRKESVEEHHGQEVSLFPVKNQSIDGMYFQGTEPTGLIYLHGSACFYEETLSKPLEWIQACAYTNASGQKLYPHLLVFNPRGTGRSQGIPHPQAIAEDIEAAFEFLVVEHQVDPCRIVIAGHSMGGFFAAFGAERVQNKYAACPLNFVSDRSFYSIKDRVHAYLEARDENDEVRRLGEATVWRLVVQAGWNRDPEAALRKLKGRVCVLYHRQDPVIPYPTSLYAALEKRKWPANYVCLELGGGSLQEEDAHNRALDEREQHQLALELKRMWGHPLQ